MTLIELGQNFPLIDPFLRRLEQLNIMDTTRTGLRHIYDKKPLQLKLEIAAAIDMRSLIEVTYLLEGDGLTIRMVWRRIEALRKLGRDHPHHGGYALPNVEAVLRGCTALVRNVKIAKTWTGYGVCAPASLLASARPSRRCTRAPCAPCTRSSTTWTGRRRSWGRRRSARSC
jgi:hypothetical protein